MKTDLYQRVTDAVISSLEQGVRPWVRPWNAEHAAGRISRPLRSTGQPYQGVNVLVLWMESMEKGFSAPLWMTFKQALELGGNVRKGERGSHVVYASTYVKGEEGEEQQIPFLKSYTVFNAEQIDNLPSHFYAMAQTTLEPMQRIEAAESFFHSVPAEVRHGGNMAYYNIGQDFVQLPTFEGAAAKHADAVKAEAHERDKAADSAFESLWKAAAPFFKPSAAMPESCPICTTPLDKTAAGGAVAIDTHIAKHLEGLRAYAAAKEALEAAATTVGEAHRRLLASLGSLYDLLHDDQVAAKTAIAAYRDVIEAWTEGDAPASIELVNAIAILVADVDAKIQEITDKQGEQTYAKAKVKVDTLLELKAEHASTTLRLAELAKLTESLNAQAATVSNAIRAKVQSLLDRLRKPTNEIYGLIQGTGAAPIRLELPPEDETNHQRLHLLVDFADNRPAVQPSGYLSDSQIHSLALALRLAAILEFNTGALIVVLDDIVTSYDADHRRTIAKMFAAKFADCQVIVATHDERFFLYLKELLAPTTWHFTRIIGVAAGHGPRFADDMVSDEMIEERWDDGKSAANEMRQAEEEWLLERCREFGVNVRIRPLERPYSYERAELASALAGFLGGAKLVPQQLSGMQDRFLDTLQKGEVENFGSHFQDAMYGAGSIGDERTRWDEFKAFRAQFKCPKCARTRFKRPVVLKKPVCAHDGCEAQFEFASAPAAPSGAPAAG